MCTLLARLTLTLVMLISAAPLSFAQQTDPASIDEIDETDKLAAVKAAGDTNLIESTRPIIAEADTLIQTINRMPSSTAKADYLDELRTIRSKITKRTPQIRTLVEALRATKTSLGYGNVYGKSGPQVGLPAYLEPSNLPERLDDEYRNALTELVTLIKNEPANPRVSEIQAVIATLTDQLQRRDDLKKQADEIVRKSQEEYGKRENLRLAQSAAVDEYINLGIQSISELDDRLDIIDDISGSLIATAAQNADYTDKSTIVFAVLVGGVIIGFFVIAATSKSVKEAIFTGDSGIQFVTMFSLVIAIILFGVLKILEGRELAALLGGLSGYILGRGSQTVENARATAQVSNPVNATKLVKPAPVVISQPDGKALSPVQLGQSVGPITSL